MKQFVYSPADAGLSEWPSGTLRLQDVEVTEDPNAADVFVYPGALFNITSRAGLEALPYFKEHENQHVFFHCSDHEVLYDTTAVIIRCNTRTWMLERDPTTLSWPWPVEDYSECIEPPEGGLKYDVSFQGWNWSDARKASIKSCRENASLKCDFSTYGDFFGYLKPSDSEFVRRRAEFRRSMKESRIALCPESIPGVFPYRFFEAMSAGRVPLLVGANYVLPLADEIPYDDFMLSTTHLDKAGEIAASFVSSYRDETIIEMGRLARQAWEQWLDSRKWPQLMAYAVQKKLGVLQSA